MNSSEFTATTTAIANLLASTLSEEDLLLATIWLGSFSLTQGNVDDFITAL